MPFLKKYKYMKAVKKVSPRVTGFHRPAVRNLVGRFINFIVTFSLVFYLTPRGRKWSCGFNINEIKVKKKIR